VGKNCHIEQAILDKNCRVGDNVTIKGGAGLANIETDSYCIVDGIVVVKKGAVIEHGTKIGVTE
jgi:glucose-1-phosphate adenylyltransferase